MVDKYAGAAGTLEEVLTYRAQIGTQITDLKKQDQDFSQIHAAVADLQKKLTQTGTALTKTRQKAADALVPKVHTQLAELGMKDARFGVQFAPAGSADAADAGAAANPSGGGGGAQSTGLETVEFMIAPNPGQAARPLRKIASGGELSRAMLALKSILAQADRVSVLVFDEIDANIGGRMGTVIGEKLRTLARMHQVLCITHLPQIAAFADRHLTIRKATTGGESFTTVSVVEGDVRVQELAEMITGKDVTATSQAQARELLGLADRPAAATKPVRPAKKTTSGK